MGSDGGGLPWVRIMESQRRKMVLYSVELMYSTWRSSKKYAMIMMLQFPYITELGKATVMLVTL